MDDENPMPPVPRPDRVWVPALALVAAILLAFGAVQAYEAVRLDDGEPASTGDG